MVAIAAYIVQPKLKIHCFFSGEAFELVFDPVQNESHINVPLVRKGTIRLR